MKLKLFLILLLNGLAQVVLFIQPDAPTYYFISQAMTWPDAQKYCNVMYTDLAPFKTYNDFLKLQQIATANSYTYPIWIGLYDDMNWRWSFHDLPLTAITLQKWSGGEPSNTFPGEECVFLKTLGVWIDSPCSKLHPFICYNAKNPGNSRFVGITTPMNWTDARYYCRSFHTDLATTRDATDHDMVMLLVAAQGDSWIGLFRDGWTWTDHSKALNISWGPGHPDNYYKNENCARLWTGTLDDMSCNYVHAFICYYIPPIKRKVLKLQVKSDQNVFDPAVQASLLTKMVQKLQEHGMSTNITVTWRLQPDGNIFYKK